MFSDLEVQEIAGTLSLSDHLPDIFQDPDSYTKVMNVGVKGDVLLTFSETSGISAALSTASGLKPFAKEDMPKEFRFLNTIDDFTAFLENAYSLVSDRSDGTHGLKILQRLYGGVGGEKGGRDHNADSGNRGGNGNGGGGAAGGSAREDCTTVKTSRCLRVDGKELCVDHVERRCNSTNTTSSRTGK